MALGTRENNTMAEGCRKILGILTDMKVLPDCDDQFVSAIESAVIGYLRNPTPQEQAQGPMGSAMGQVMQGSPQASGPGMGPGPAPGSPGMPPMDEMRRMLTPTGP